MATRINKYLSEVGYCSRRVADRLIEEGRVTINGEIPEIGTKVNKGDQVEVEGQIIEKSTHQKKIFGRGRKTGLKYRVQNFFSESKIVNKR